MLVHLARTKREGHDNSSNTQPTNFFLTCIPLLSQNSGDYPMLELYRLDIAKPVEQNRFHQL